MTLWIIANVWDHNFHKWYYAIHLTFTIFSQWCAPNIQILLLTKLLNEVQDFSDKILLSLLWFAESFLVRAEFRWCIQTFLSSLNLLCPLFLNLYIYLYIHFCILKTQSSTMQQHSNIVLWVDLPRFLYSLLLLSTFLQ